MKVYDFTKAKKKRDKLKSTKSDSTKLKEFIKNLKQAGIEAEKNGARL